MHSSYTNEHRMEKYRCNERLEFLGDAVLELVSSEFLFRQSPKVPEGELTKTRASMVCEPVIGYVRERHRSWKLSSSRKRGRGNRRAEFVIL